VVDRIDVLWHCAALHSAEHAVVRHVGSNWHLSGSAALPVGDYPGHIEYTVLVNESWTFETADVEVWVGPTQRSHRIDYSEGEWTVDNRQRTDLTACQDLDLGWTPMTNLIPIRRCDVAVGESFELMAAWLRFPELSIEPNPQRYTRLAADRWRYESGPYDFELTVDASGLVMSYGDDLWRAVARTET
jgi:uncharacterized protein